MANNSNVENIKYLLSYSKYQENGLSASDFCRLNNLDYLDFEKFVNKWEDIHGRNFVENCMERTDITPRKSKHAEYIPSRAQRLFKELVVEPERGEHRSLKRFPSNPDITVHLEHPTPNTVVRGASIMFPSGVEVSFEVSSASFPFKLEFSLLRLVAFLYLCGYFFEV